jgi:ribosomal protein S21
MAEEQQTPGPRRRGRPPGNASAARSSAGTRRRRIGGAELVETLNEQVNMLIKENRRLKRQLDKASAGVTAAAAGAVEKTLRSLHRKVQRAMGSAPATRRRRASGAPAAPRRRTQRARASSAEPRS